MDPRRPDADRPQALGAGAAVVNGRVYAVAGPAGDHFDLTPNKAYDAASDSSTRRAPVPTGRRGIGVVPSDGRLYVFGGERIGAGGGTFDDADRYYPAGDGWETPPRMPTVRHVLGCRHSQPRHLHHRRRPQPGLRVQRSQ